MQTNTPPERDRQSFTLPFRYYYVLILAAFIIAAAVIQLATNGPEIANIEIGWIELEPQDPAHREELRRLAARALELFGVQEQIPANERPPILWSAVRDYSDALEQRKAEMDSLRWTVRWHTVAQLILASILAGLLVADYRALHAAYKAADESEIAKRYQERDEELKRRTEALEERERQIPRMVQEQLAAALSAHEGRLSRETAAAQKVTSAAEAKRKDADDALGRAREAQGRADRDLAEARRILEDAELRKRQATLLRDKAAEHDRHSSERARVMEAQLRELRALCGFTMERIAKELTGHPELVRLIIENAGPEASA